MGVSRKGDESPMKMPWTIDTAKSRIGFTVRHMMSSKVHGVFRRWSGDLSIDPADLSTSSVTIAIDAVSVDTADRLRDEYLRSASFFDPVRHPHIAFQSTQIERMSPKGCTLRGDLTIRTKTRPVVLTVTIDPAWAGPSTRRLVCKASTRVDRRDFDLQWNAALEAGGLVVADRVDIAVEIVASPA